MTRMTMGISHPAGKSRTFSDHGRSFWCNASVTWVPPAPRKLKKKGNAVSQKKRGTYCYNFVVLDGDDDSNDADDDE